ncbi:hypothetical protein FVR03_20185 [Pontibacter qinzhouensis]|uniref:Uncharacterized protein n=1 Tax=Pontibacter qinzhouensis TaxID=2603253 RepID=A0A5C8J462_9BACT|nr:hypothetical protein [Pontibacter qinzhouensis]TXK30862.1 hypothetical protein FVR03_20185 [Pontibacter qinzhouensis]
MSGWGYEIGQEGFGIKYRDEDDIERVRGFAEKLPFMTYIGELSDEDDDGEYYDCIYYVDNTTFKSYRRKEKIRVALEA